MRAELSLAVEAFRLALPRAGLAGQAGARLGRGTGSSLELADFREYVPGDDPRHIDWRGYARTDRLHVRLFREEIAPHLDVIADTSASLASTPGKERAFRDLVVAFQEWGRHAGCATRVLAAGGEVLDDPERAELAGSLGDLVPRAPLRPRGLRVVISDFLLPSDPVPLLRRLAAGAAHVWVVGLLDPWELDPSADGLQTLIDCETGARAAVALLPRTIAVYKERLQRLLASVAAATRGSAGTWACVSAAEPRVMFERTLLPQGVVEPA